MNGQAHFPVMREIVRRWCARAAVAFALLPLSLALWAAPEPPLPSIGERLAEARRQRTADPTNVAPCVDVARLAFAATTQATQTAEKAALAEEGIAVARAGLVLQPKSAALEYYLGLNLGQLASTRGLSALKLVREMEAHLLAARKLDPLVADAGPDRSLGYLYRQAPGWPLSIGSHDKARQHFGQAWQLAPDRPEHLVALAEACLQQKQRTEARRLLEGADALWERARSRYSGPDWDGDWADWNARLRQLRETLE